MIRQAIPPHTRVFRSLTLIECPENHDNYATDHLDFNYQIEGLEGVDVSGPNSSYSREDIVGRRTAHDARMDAAVRGTGWPLVRQFEAAPLEAGTVILYSHNVRTLDTIHPGLQWHYSLALSSCTYIVVLVMWILHTRAALPPWQPSTGSTLDLASQAGK